MSAIEKRNNEGKDKGKEERNSSLQKSYLLHSRSG